MTNTASKQSIHIYIVEPEQIDRPPAGTPLVIVGLLEDIDLLNKLISTYNTIIAIQDYNNYNDVISQIYFNDYKIGWQAAQLLAEYHHNKILLLAGPEKYPSSFYRKKGFLDALKELGLPANIHTDKMNWAGGYYCGDYLLKEFSEEERPTAVFATNDWMAIGLMQKLKENGLNIPQDISIVGCDDIPLSSEFIPTLTTFNLDMKYLVSELFALFDEINTSKNEMTRKVVLPATLIIRDSLINLETKLTY
jgi:DNA-binding LacI/PurR family transcriptional regulator